MARFRKTLAITAVLTRASQAFTTQTCLSKLVDQYDAFILDQFGTKTVMRKLRMSFFGDKARLIKPKTTGVMHNGVEALPGAIECVQELHRRGKKLIILSNTSAPAAKALERLPKFGFDAAHFETAVTSGEEASKYVRKRFGSNSLRKSKCVFLTWDATDADNPRLTAHPQAFLDQCGYVEVAASVEEADFVLFHGSQVWYRGEDVAPVPLDFIDTGSLTQVNPLLQACLKLPAVCANPDFVVRTPEGSEAHMPGRLAERFDQLLSECSDDEPHERTIVFGKPHASHFEACLQALQVKRVAHVGDSLRHDVQGASACGIETIFVTGGIHCNELGVDFGVLPSEDRLRKLFDETGDAPTHVVPTFCWKS